MTVTVTELHQVTARHRRAVDRARALQTERDKMIGQALAEGWTHAKIAGVTGLTRGRIGQFARAVE